MFQQILHYKIQFVYLTVLVEGERQQNSLDYYDAFSYPSVVVILNSNIRNEYYDKNLNKNNGLKIQTWLTLHQHIFLK